MPQPLSVVPFPILHHHEQVCPVFPRVYIVSNSIHRRPLPQVLTLLRLSQIYGQHLTLSVRLLLSNAILI